MLLREYLISTAQPTPFLREIVDKAVKALSDEDRRLTEALSIFDEPVNIDAVALTSCRDARSGRARAAVGITAL